MRGGTKGDRFRRVEFGPRIGRILGDLRARQTGHAAADHTRRPVFATAEGSHLDRRELSRGPHKEALADAGLRESLRLHDTEAHRGRIMARGRPAADLRQRQPGHAAITTTERQYGHLEKSFLRGAARRAEVAVWEGASRRLRSSRPPGSDLSVPSLLPRDILVGRRGTR